MEEVNARNIASGIEEKITEDQARKIILNLDDSTVSLEAIRNQLSTWPIKGLEEVIVVKGGRLFPLLP